MLTRPAQDVEPEAVIEAVEAGMKQTGYSDFSLLSLSCSDYLALPAVGVELRNRLADQNVTLQLPSQRVDRFDDDVPTSSAVPVRRVSPLRPKLGPSVCETSSTRG